MFSKKKKDNNELDFSKINEGVKIGVTILKIFLVLSIVALIYISSMLLTKWHILPFIATLLKIITPFFIGIVIAWLFDPAVTWFNKKGLNRVLSTVLVFTIFLGSIFLVVKLMIPSVTDQFNDIAKQAPSFVKYLQDGVEGILDSFQSGTGYDVENVKKEMYTSLAELGDSITVGLPAKVMSVATSIISGSITLIFGLIIGFYMLFDFNNIRSHLISLLPKKAQSDAYALTDKLNKNLRKFIQGTLSIMLILFVFQSIGLGLAGLKAPMVFGLFCAVTNVIPYVGPYIGGIPAVLVGLSISPTTGFFCLISVLLSQLLESYFLQPIVMGKTMKLHPVTIMLGLLIFGYFFGIIGMILATPIISMTKTIVKYFDDKYNLSEKIFGID